MLKLFFGTIFLLNALLFFFQAMTKNLFPPLLLPLREAFSIDNAQAGLLVSLVFFGYALARFPSGIMADRIGCTKTVLWGSGAMALSFIGVAFSPSYPILALMTFILGVSSGIYVTAGYTLAVIIGSRDRAATATAAFESFGILAGLVSPLIVTFFVLYLNWPLLFIVQGILLSAVTVLFFRSRKSSESLEADSAASNGLTATGKTGSIPRRRASFRSVLHETYESLRFLKDPSIRRFLLWSTLVGGFGALSWTGVNAFIPTFLVQERGYSYDVANSMFILVAASGLAAKLLTGWLADRFGNNVVMFINLTFSVSMFIALSIATEHWHLIMILILLGAACLNTNTLINSYVLRSMPVRHQGAGFGLFSTAYTVIYSLGPYLTGFLSDFLGLSRAIQLSSFGAITAAILILLANRFIPQQLIKKIAAS